METISNRRLFRGLLILSLLSYLAAIWAFIVLEGKTPLEAVYFVVVTLSTVGFGDITPSHPVTQVIVILLITVGISTLAYITQAFAEKIVTRSADIVFLPSSKLSTENHVVIYGFTPVASYIAAYLKDRFFNVVVLDFEEEKVILARKKGFEAYLLLDVFSKDLEILDIEQAAVVYTFIPDENLTIKLVLTIRELNKAVPIYSKTSSEITQELAKMLGITRTYHNESLIASFINFLSGKREMFLLPHQDVVGSRFRMVLMEKEMDLSRYCSKYFPAARVGSNLEDVEVWSERSSLNQILYAIPQEEFDRSMIGDMREKKEVYDKIFIGGFSREIHHIIGHITIENQEIDILTFSEDEHQLAKEFGYNSILIEKADPIPQIEENLSNKDLVINMFEEALQSLNLSLSIRKSRVSPVIFQYVKSPVEHEIFKKVKVDRVFSPRMLTARAMILIFLAKIQQCPSFITEEHQVFEHIVQTNDHLIGKNVQRLKKDGYKLLLLDRDGEIISRPREDLVIREGDNLVLYKSIET